MYGTQVLQRTAIGATVSHVRNDPHEWGRGPAGFAKRVGSGLGTHAVKTSVTMGVAALRHEDLRYRPSHKKGFGPRLGYALSSTVITHKTTTGKKTFASAKTSGNLAAGLVSRAWQPARLRTVGGGLSTAGIMTGVDAGSNVVQEFWPEIRHPKRHKRG